MGKENWAKDIFDEHAYHEVDGKRKLSFDKVMKLLKLNDLEATHDKLSTAKPHEAGRVAMTAQNALRGAALKKHGLHVSHSDFRKAPADWVAENTPAPKPPKAKAEAAA